MNKIPVNADPATSKFEGAILHWTVKKMPDGWQQEVCNVLAGISDVVVQQDGDVVLVQVFATQLKLVGKRSAGSLLLGYGDWLVGLILLRLARCLPIEMVDDSSMPVDRRSLKSLFVAADYEFADEFEDFAVKLGLIPKLDSSIKEAISNFF
jgi:hypothetical protein